MTRNRNTVLIVDDEEFNLDLIEEFLGFADIECVRAQDGQTALDILEADDIGRFSAIILDRMMPGLDGIEVIKRIKANPGLMNLPIIMQTAMARKDNMLEGLAAGAHYYLAKPYDSETLTTIVTAAVRDYARLREQQDTIRDAANSLTMMEEGTFSYRTIDEGKRLAIMLANATTAPDRVVLGLTELMINAVEHGNLGITYDEKSTLNEEGAWKDEVDRRLSQTRYKDRTVTVDFKRTVDTYVYTIRDEGDGFEWDEYMEISPERAFDTHGRGIAMAKMISFSSVEYSGKGNVVCAKLQRSDN